MKRRSVRMAFCALAAGALLWVIHAQVQSTGVPFLTTPFIAGFSYSSGISLLARQSDSTYVQLQFAVNSPYTIVSSMAELATIISTGLKPLEALPASPSNVGPAAQFAALADFTGDGSPGVAYVNVAGNSPSFDVYLGTPAFLLRSHNSYIVPGTPGNVIAADFNRDGKPDLAVGYYATASQGLAILLNNGDGTFGKAVSYGPALVVSSFATLDLNHDGIPDIVALGSSGTTGSLFVLLGKGDGTFTNGASYPLQAGSSVTIADVNGDGNPDVAALTSLGFSIFLGKGDGTFIAGPATPGPASTTYIAAGDLNGDGKIDIVISARTCQCASIYLGKGDGTFTAGASYAVSYDPDSIILTDYNHDGKLDIIAGIGDERGIGPGFDSTNIDVLIGNGDGSFQGASVATGSTGNATFLIAADFDGDGKLDAITNDLDGGKLSLYKGNGNGTFQAATQIANLDTNGQAGPKAAATADFNHDGKSDLATADFYSDSVSVLLNSGNGFETPVAFPSGGSDPTSIGAADFDGDGKADLVVANAGEGPSATLVANVAVFHGNGDGTFQPAATLQAGASPSFVTVADLNGDGHPDLLVADIGANYGGSPGNVWIFLSNGHGGFSTGVSYRADASPTFIAVGDLNGDGKPDLAVSTRDASFDYEVAILLGNGNGTFQAAALIPTGFGVDQIAISDFNGDGKVDLAVSHCCGFTDMTFLPGTGNGTFGSEIHFNGGPSPDSLIAVDLNADGKLDLLIGANGTGTATVLLNKPSSATSSATTVNGASFNANLTVAPDSIASIFGGDLANQTLGATTLGTSLGGTSVSFTDAAGAIQPGKLFFVSPGQVNAYIPPGLASGTAAVQVTSGDGTVSNGTVTIAPVAPGVFALNNLALGYSLVAVNGALQYTPTVKANPSQAGSFIANPIALGSTTGTYLILFGTGIRGAQLSQVSVQIGGVVVTPSFAGAEGEFAGEDQVNVLIPSSLAGSGDNAVVLTAAGIQSNTVHITIQ